MKFKVCHSTESFKRLRQWRFLLPRRLGRHHNLSHRCLLLAAAARRSRKSSQAVARRDCQWPWLDIFSLVSSPSATKKKTAWAKRSKHIDTPIMLNKFLWWSNLNAFLYAIRILIYSATLLILFRSAPCCVLCVAVASNKVRKKWNSRCRPTKGKMSETK